MKTFLTNLFTELEAIRISGDKEGGEDIKKLAWIEKALSAGIINKEGDIIPITTNVLPEPAVQGEGEGEAMSATQVRNDAWNNDFNWFAAKYGSFYGNTFTEPIYNAINTYKPNTIALEITGRKRKKGGSNKRRKLTKRRKSKRHNQSKRRRRRQTKRN